MLASSKTATKKVKDPEFFLDKDSLKNLKLIAVAYSSVERDWFPTEDSYKAEVEVEERAQEVIEEISKLELNVKGYPGDQYFLTNILVDKPDLVINLVDTVRGEDRLQISIPAALELSGIKYTGSDMQGLVLGNNRHLIKQLLIANNIPTPDFKFIKDLRTHIPEDFALPIIVKLNESGGSVGIDNHAIKESIKKAQERVEEMIKTYKIPVIVEKFIEGPEITAIVYEDGTKKHVFLGKKVFRKKIDGKHYFTSLESYEDGNSYKYDFVEEELESKIIPLVIKVFDILKYKDYAKFDIRLDVENNKPHFIDCNANTAFGPDIGLPMTEVLDLHGIKFDKLLTSLLSKYAKSTK